MIQLIDQGISHPLVHKGIHEIPLRKPFSQRNYMMDNTLVKRTISLKNKTKQNKNQNKTKQTKQNKTKQKPHTPPPTPTQTNRNKQTKK